MSTSRDSNKSPLQLCREVLQQRKMHQYKLNLLAFLLFQLEEKEIKLKHARGADLFNEGEIVWFDLFNINSNFALAVEVIFAASD